MSRQVFHLMNQLIGTESRRGLDPNENSTEPSNRKNKNVQKRTRGKTFRTFCTIASFIRCYWLQQPQQQRQKQQQQQAQQKQQQQQRQQQQQQQLQPQQQQLQPQQ